MAELTAEQVHDLGKFFLDAGEAAGNYLREKFEELSPEERLELRQLSRSLVFRADALFTHSAGLVMDDAKEALTKIKSIHSDIEKTLSSLQSIQKAIEITAGLVALGAALMSRNPQEVGTSLDKVMSKIKN